MNLSVGYSGAFRAVNSPPLPISSSPAVCLTVLGSLLGCEATWRTLLDQREVTTGQALQKAGYRTGVIGKWDSGRARRFLPLQRGDGQSPLGSLAARDGPGRAARPLPGLLTVTQAFLPVLGPQTSVNCRRLDSPYDV